MAPLRLPPPGAQDPLDYPAVRLFTDRAVAVRHDFAVTPDNLAQVVGVCASLDGLPLAIELAAARLRTLSLAEVAERLDDRFMLLSRGSRTALPRHQTLRAVVAWSWDLLDPEEQQLARRLTVFVGGARVEAVRQVCDAGPDLLESLAEKSLIELSGGRFRMLETIRAYGAERLAEAGEVTATRAAHAGYALDLATTADAHLRTRDQLPWLARLDEESDDLHAALRWAADTGRLDLGLRLLAHLACYWWLRGYRTIGSHLAADLLERVGEEIPDGLEEEYALCLLTAGAEGRGGPRVQKWAVEVALAVRQRMPFRLEFLTMMLALFTGPPDEPMDREPLLLVATPWTLALSRSGDGFACYLEGDLPGAKAAFSESLAEFQAIGERWGMTQVLSGLQDLAVQEGDHVTALTLADRALGLAEELGASADAAEYLCRKADCVVHLGELADAEAIYLRAAERARRVGSLEMQARAHLGLGLAARLDGRPGDARAYTEQALAEVPDTWFSSGDIKVRAHAALGWLALDAGELTAAWSAFATAIEQAVSPIYLIGSSAVEGLAETARRSGDLDLAARLPAMMPAELAHVARSAGRQ
ncbi:hypothetical protein GCM10009560_73030 [Nonomuraea longicatena]|uniref:Uncharacterized protein n=1 Tax=Nonomuraea longicatena TaxID=83682 RepID=A0ABN1R4N8_9ACTN